MKEHQLITWIKDLKCRFADFVSTYILSLRTDRLSQRRNSCYMNFAGETLKKNVENNV